MFKIKIEYLALVVVAVLLAVGVHNKSIPLSSDPFLVLQKSKEVKPQVDIEFQNISSLVGSREDDPRDTFTIFTAVSDYNNDGFEDIALVNYVDGKGTYLKVLKNNAGESYEDVTNSDFNLGELENISAASFVDIDNDGFKDLYIARFMRPHIVFKNNKGKFSQLSKIAIDDIIAPTRGIYLFDYNNDGYIDIYLSSFSEKVYSAIFNGKNATSKADFPVRYHNESGNVLIENQAGTKLVVTPDALGLKDGGFTWAAGIADFDQDGYPDIYLANDFSYDRFYHNNNGKYFTEISAYALGRLRSENSMGAEVADVFNEGLFGIYVTNASKPGMPRGWDHFWVQNENKSLKLSDQSRNLEIDKCGFSWGSRFVDFNKDGNLDLFVANGRTGIKGNNSNRWYYRLYDWNLPPALKFNENVAVPEEGNDYAQGQRNCLFIQNEKKFFDVATESKILDEENGRSIVATDNDNSGSEKIMIANFFHDPIMYKVIRNNSNNWIGVELKATKSNRDAIGAVVQLHTRNKVQTRINYPTNGFSSQTSGRLLFGLESTDQIEKLLVRWPAGGVSEVKNIKINQYNKIEE